jgi:hypothetical protein
MGCLLSLDLIPHYAQVAIFDPAISDSYPDWPTGTEPIAVGTHGIAVATRPDWSSDNLDLSAVRLEVWDTIPDRKACEIFSGSISATSLGLVAGNMTGNSLHSIKLLPGTYEIAVLVDPVAEPEFVCFLLGNILSS